MIRLVEPLWLHGWWVAAGIAVVVLVGAWRRRRAMARFASRELEGTIVQGRGARRGATRAVLVGTALGLVAVALARPQGRVLEEAVELRGRDVVFVVDVSRSMLARDLAPNRLERARLWINDLVGTLGGDRVGLVAFAGNAVVKSPLTHDHEFFRLALSDLSPASVSRGGTLIGDALRTALRDVFGEEGEGAHRDVVLITDGEDHESLPVEAARSLGERGIRVIVLGVGDPSSGAPVPGEGSGFVEYQGEMVRSRMDPAGLAKIAHATPGGVFLNVGTGNMDLDRVYADLISSAPAVGLASASATRREELFPIALAGAFALLALEGLMGGRHVGSSGAARGARR